MIGTIHFITQAPQSGQPVIITSWVELLAVATFTTILSAFATAYHHIECHEEGCHRLGRFPYKHFKLCHVHHPHVPSDGKINADVIAKAGEVTTVVRLDGNDIMKAVQKEASRRV